LKKFIGKKIDKQFLVIQHLELCMIDIWVV
jgi:hypothetical protein